MISSPTVPDDARRRKADREEEGDAVAVRAVTIGMPRDEVYARFRRFSDLPRFMENLERVEELDATRSHWVVKAPAGQKVEWDAVVTAAEPGRRIAWSTSDGAQVKNHGEVEFLDAPAGRGTVVRAAIAYEPPGGALGKLIAELFQKEPGVQAKRDLRRFKMWLETGEIATTHAPGAAPRYDKSKASDEARAQETR